MASVSRILLVCIVCLTPLLESATPACPSAKHPQAEQAPAEPKRLDAASAADLEHRIRKLYAQLAPSVVRFFDPKGQGGFSGVIVSSSGEILTCAHHNLPPQTKVTVELA